MKKTFRLFISSTFNDFRKEREVLQAKVFPHAKEYASKQGYTFQPIDLRWGVSNEAQLDQKTLELCLSEVRACKSHVHPNFLLMIGDRYGWVSLPYAIQTDEFETLTALMTQSDKEAVLEWYKKDLNELPASYILKERNCEYEEFERWLTVETNLRIILQSAVMTSNLTEEQKRKYFLSATEAEVEEGIIPYIKPTKYQEELLSEDSTLETVDPEHIFGFFRDIDKSTKIKDKFIMDDYEEAQLFKERVAGVLEDKNILHVKTTQIDEESLEEIYLIEFEAKITEFLEFQIDVQKAKETDEQLTPLEIELQAQSYFAQIKRKDFLAQESLRETIANYILDDNNQQLIIYGASGRGKSSLMAKVIQEAEALHKRVIYRFVGATPYSSSSKEILTSIFEELGVDVRSEQEKVQTQEDKLRKIDSDENQESFVDFSYRIYSEINSIKENIVIFIDAVDQLGNDDEFLWLPTKLPKNVKIVISVLNDASYKDDSRYFITLKTKTQTIYEIPEFSEPKLLLAALLKKEDRTLQKEQETYFLEQFKSSPSPLYVSVAAQELKNWKSYDSNQEIESTQHGIIKEFVENLHSVYHHNKEFAHKVLGYIYASRDGLSESELLQLFATDEEFIQRMAPEIFHKNETYELPLVHWSRLHTQLKPFLSIKKQDNEELMYFFHREFEDVIANMPNQKDEHQAIIQANQTLITQNQERPFEQNRWGKLYATLITEHELRYKEKDKLQEYAAFVVKLENIEWIYSFLSNMSELGLDYNKHNHMYHAIAYEETVYYSAKMLYKENPEKWAEGYSVTLNNIVIFYYKQNRLNEAIELGENALGITKELYKENPEIWVKNYIISLNSLAFLYYIQNRLNEAIELGEKALGITKELYKESPEIWAEDYAIRLNNLAQFYEKQNRLNEATELGEKALGITKELYKENPARLANAYNININNLASFYYKQNRLNEATELGEKALGITKELYKESPEIWAEAYSRGLNNLAPFYEKQNRLNEATELGEKALGITKELYKENPARWALYYNTILNNLAPFYEKQNRLNEAIELGEKALGITKELYKENPERWADNYTRSLDNLAFFYYKQNSFDKAIELGEKVLGITKELYKENPERLAEDYSGSLNNLASFYYKQNRLNEAIELGEKALGITKELYKENPERWAEDYVIRLNNLAQFYEKQNRLNEVIELREKALGITKELYKESPEIWAEDYSGSLNNLAFLYYSQNRLNEAIELGEKAFGITKELYKENPERLAEDYSVSLNNLASFYYSQNSFDKATEFLQKALGITKELYKESPEIWAEDYSRSLNNLASLKAKNKKYIESSKLFSEYFQIINFKQQEDITNFIYPFVQWYHCEEKLQNPKEIARLDAIAQKLTKLYKEKLGKEYEVLIKRENQNYKNSDDLYNEEKYYIFVKIFMSKSFY